MENRLTNPQLSHLKGLGQLLDPMLKVGRAGLSDGFIKSVDDALERHELVKVKFDEFKEEKKVLAPQLAEKTRSRLVMRVGNVAVLWRQQPDPAKQKIKLP